MQVGGVTRGDRTIEDSLDDIVSATNDTLAAVERTRKSSSVSQHHLPESGYGLYETSQSSSRMRATSASGMPSSRIVAFDDEQANEEQKRSDAERGGDRKYELILRKMRLVEERVKRIEHHNTNAAQTGQAEREEMEKLMDSQKVDKRLVQNLRSQVSSLKTRVDMLLSNEEQQRTTSSNVDPAYLVELVRQRVQEEMNKSMEDIISRCLQKQSMPKSRVDELDGTSASSSSNNDIFSRSAGVEQFSHLEKELIRLSSEFERMRTRQAALDSSCSDLKKSTSIRELKAEEAHKRSIHAHQVEVATFLGAAGRKVNDALSTVRTNSEDILQLKEDLGTFIENSGHAMADFDMRIGQNDESVVQLQEIVGNLENENNSLKSQVQDAEANVARFLEDSLKLAKVAGLTDSNTRELQVQSKRLEALDMATQAATSATEAHAVPIDMLAKSIDAINEKFESRTDILRQTVDAQRDDLQASIKEVYDAQKKLKGKVKDLSESIKNVSQIRQSIEAVLREVDNRAKQDASWTYSFKTSVQKLNLRLGALERYLNKSASGAQQRDSGGGAGMTGAKDSNEGLDDDDDHAAAASTIGQYSSDSAYIPLVGNQFDEMRIIIDELRTEMKSYYNDEHAKLSDLFTGMLESQLDDLQQKIRQEMEDAQEEEDAKHKQQQQRMAERTEQSLQRVRDTIMDVQDQLLADHEQLEKTTKLQESVQQLRDQITGIAGVVDEHHAATSERMAELQQAAVAADQQVDARMGTLETNLRNSAQSSGDAALRQDEQLQRLGEKLDNQVSSTREALDGLNGRVSDGVVLMNSYIDKSDARFTSLGAGIEAKAVAVEELSSKMVDENRNLRELLLKTQNTSSAQCAVLQDDLNILKEDLTAHINFTNEIHADIQASIDSRYSDVENRLSSMSIYQDHILSRCDESKTATHQVGSAIRELVTDLNERLVEENALTSRQIAQLEVTLASNDAGMKNKMATTDKRLAAQEAAMKERVATLETRLASQEDALKTRVADMEGSLASQGAALKESIPRDVAETQEAELERKITEVNDTLKAQLSTVKDRVAEMEDRVAGQEGEIASFSALSQETLAAHQAQVAEALASSETKQSSAISKAVSEILRSGQERDEELERQLTELTQRLEAQEDNSDVTVHAHATRMEELEKSVAATDDLVMEQVNFMLEKVAELKEGMHETKESEATHSSSAVAAVQAVETRLASLESAATRKTADLEHQIASQAAPLKVKLTEMENKVSSIEDVVTTKLAPVSLHLNAHQAEINQLAEVDESLSSQTAALSDQVKQLEATVQEQYRDVRSELLAVKEASQQTATVAVQPQKEAAAESVAGDGLPLSPLVTLQQRVSDVAASIEGVVQSHKDVAGRVDVLEDGARYASAQLNDHVEELHAKISSTTAELHDTLSNEIAEATAASTMEALDPFYALQKQVETQKTDLQQCNQQVQDLDTAIHQVSSAVAEQVTQLQSNVGESKAGQQDRIDSLQRQLESHEASTKAKLNVIDQRLIRQDAAAKERYVVEMQPQLTGLNSRVDALEQGNSELQNVLQKMQEIEQSLSCQGEETKGQIEEIEGFIAKQVRAITGQQMAADMPPALPSAPPAAAAGTAETDLSAIIDDDYVEQEGGGGGSSSSSSANAAGIRAADASELFGSPGGKIRSNKGSSNAKNTVLNNEGKEEDGEDEEDGRYDDSTFEAEEEEEEEEGNAGGILPVVGVSSTTGGDGGRNLATKEEDSEEEEEQLAEFNSLIDTVNFDIATLGMHLESFRSQTGDKKTQKETGRDAAEAEEAANRERQEAIESLQLKKLYHRKKFQKALFENSYTATTAEGGEDLQQPP